MHLLHFQNVFEKESLSPQNYVCDLIAIAGGSRGAPGGHPGSTKITNFRSTIKQKRKNSKHKKLWHLVSWKSLTVTPGVTEKLVAFKSKWVPKTTSKACIYASEWGDLAKSMRIRIRMGWRGRCKKACVYASGWDGGRGVAKSMHIRIRMGGPCKKHAYTHQNEACI